VNQDVAVSFLANSEGQTGVGGKPTVLGDIISPIIGKVAGDLISMTGLEDTLAINIMIEQKAMKDYNA